MSDVMKWIFEYALEFDGDECLTWPFARGKDGYASCVDAGGVIGVHGKSTNAHRLICIFAHGVPPSSIHQAAHLCGKGAQGCVNPRHLCWATPKENAEHKRVHFLNRPPRTGEQVVHREFTRLADAWDRTSPTARRQFHKYMGSLPSEMGANWSWGLLF